MHVMHLDIHKGVQNGFKTDLKSGDKVRVDDTEMFKKGSKTNKVFRQRTIRWWYSGTQ